MYDDENNESENEFKMDDDIDLDSMDPIEKEDLDDDPEDRYH